MTCRCWSRHYVSRFGRELGAKFVDIAPAAVDRLATTLGPATFVSCKTCCARHCYVRGRTLLPEFLPELSQTPNELRSNGEAPASSAARAWKHSSEGPSRRYRGPARGNAPMG